MTAPRRPRNQRRVPDSEAAFQDEVLALARLYGWRCYHTHDSRRSQPGFPDLVLLRPPRLIFAELKAEAGRVRPEQREWLGELQVVADAVRVTVEAHGARDALDGITPTGYEARPSVEVYLWRPADLQEIAHALAGNDVDPAIGAAWAAERRPQAVTPPARHRNTLGGLS